MALSHVYDYDISIDRHLFIRLQHVIAYNVLKYCFLEEQK